MGASDTPILDVDGLVAGYAPPRRGQSPVNVVDGVSLQVRGGELVALVGESGSGKTTTVRAIARLLDPFAGRVSVLGEDVTRARGGALRALRQRVQLVYQDPYEALDPRFSVRALVEEPLRVGGSALSREERRALVVEALERVGLTPGERFAERYPHELSGGQRQRVAIAASLVTQPRLLIADEPVSMLDVSIRAGILELFARLRREQDLGILMVTHDLAMAAHVADRIAVFYGGRIVEEGPAAEVASAPAHPYSRALLSLVPERAGEPPSARPLPGETPAPGNRPTGCGFRGRCPAAVERCATVDPQLAAVGDGRGGHRAACLLAGDQQLATAGAAPSR